MKHKCLSIFLLVTMGLAATYSALAQKPSGEKSQDRDASGKSCIAIFGAVRSPARMELRLGVHLAEAIAAAGGPSERAGETSTIQIIHLGSGLNCDQASLGNRVTGVTPITTEFHSLQDLLRGEAKANPQLQAGDIVIVAEIPAVYVIGSVFQPQSIFPRSPVTLMQAIAMAGGVLPDSKTERVRIIRSKQPGDTSPTVFTFDLKAIMNHQAEDPVLQPYDIIDVPRKTRGHDFQRPMWDPPMKLQIPLRVTA